MDLRKEISTAFQFVILVCLLFWSLSWNLPTDYDPFQESVGRYSKAKNRKDVEELVESNKKEILETLKSLRSRDSSPKILLPPFNAWKKEELTRQEANIEEEIKNKHSSKSPKRKLNYASSKCGAKILSSNPEASYQSTILNENFEEYMLNPCRARIWFEIELCDTIEVTQIEMANYELYSSSPKHFSVFWSNIYPPQQWRNLGSFEAKDRRTMQTYNVTAQNYGKFLKVLILSHYGKEHFCPMSVLRVLGYSMIYEYEDLEVKNKTSDGATKTQKRNQNDNNKLNAKKVQPTSSNAKDLNSLKAFHRSSKSSKHFICKLNKECSEKCSMFLKSIAPKVERMNSKHSLRTKSYNSLNSKKVSDGREPKKLYPYFNSRGNISKYTENFKSIIVKYTKFCPINITSNATAFRHKKEITRTQQPSLITKNVPPSDQIPANARNSKTQLVTEVKASHQRKLLQECSVRENAKTCACEETSSPLQATASIHAVTQNAKLIQKESVITKLSNRIRDSEVNLNLVNQYLQRLSESYRQEMENMQLLLNGALKAMGEAEKKSTVIDEKRSVSIKNMEKKMSNLYHKVEYFMDGHHFLLKRVMELHGLFLLLEFIVMSTIFTIFVNNFKQKIIKARQKSASFDEGLSHY